LGFRVESLGFRVYSLEFGAQGVGSMHWGFVFSVVFQMYTVRFASLPISKPGKVQDSRVNNLGFRV
jgi:hypothetical protein